MPQGEWIDIQKGQHLVILIHLVTGDLAVDDLAEPRVSHVILTPRLSLKYCRSLAPPLPGAPRTGRGRRAACLRQARDRASPRGPVLAPLWSIQRRSARAGRGTC